MQLFIILENCVFFQVLVISIHDVGMSFLHMFLRSKGLAQSVVSFNARVICYNGTRLYIHGYKLGVSFLLVVISVQ